MMLAKRFVLARDFASATLVAVSFGAAMIFGSSGVQASDADTSWQALQKAAAAARALSYKGIFVCQSGKQMKSVQITHLFDGTNEFARNVILDGSPREVLSQSGNVVIYNPQNEKIIIEKRRGQNMFPAVLPLNLESIKASYTLRPAVDERVAGRQAQVLVLEPKDGLRYSYKFWIDSEYGLLLKSVMFNNRNEVMESIAFNQVELIKTVELDWFKPKIDHNKNYVMEDEQVVIADDHLPVDWEIKELPAGYHKVDQMMRKVPGKMGPIVHVIFSDGLASVSLFIEHIARTDKSKAIPKSTLTTAGNTSFYANVNNGHLVTVVGEVPEATVVQIGNAVIFKK